MVMPPVEETQVDGMGNAQKNFFGLLKDFPFLVYSMFLENKEQGGSDGNDHGFSLFVYSSAERILRRL